MRFVLLLAVLPILAACGQKTEPQVEVSDYAEATPPPVGSGVARRPGTGPASFIGKWAAQADWCAHPQGAQRPIDITPVRFEGYENSCHIFSIDQTATGHQALLQCESEGQRKDERVHFKVSDQTLTLTWLDRGGTSVELLKCTSLADADTPTTTP